MNNSTKGAIQAGSAFILFLLGIGIIQQGEISRRALIISLILMALAVYLAYSAYVKIREHIPG